MYGRVSLSIAASAEDEVAFLIMQPPVMVSALRTSSAAAVSRSKVWSGGRGRSRSSSGRG